MEGTFESVCDFGVLAIVGQWACELISPGLAPLFLSDLAELGNARSHRAHVIERETNHIGDISYGSCTCCIIESLGADIAVDDGAHHEEDIILSNHVVELPYGVHDLGGGMAQLVQISEACPVHDFLCGGFALGQRGIVEEETVHRRSRLGFLAILGRNIQTTAAHDDCLVEKASG